MPLPAALLLQPDCAIKPAWAVFDPVWYLKITGNSIPSGVERTPTGLLADYLHRGAAAGHAPSPLFAECAYLSANPDIAAAVKAGRFVSGFDHFCQLGHRCQSGHWLFDDALYAGLYEDMSLDNLDAHGFHGRYDHYLRAGQHEHRLAHLLFDSRFYRARAIAAGDAAGIIDRFGPFSHFLYRLQSEATELPPSIYFDPLWAGQNQADAGPTIERYLRGNAAEHLDPVPEFSEAFYRQANPDVRAALESGKHTSGYQHFLRTGVFELRQPSAEIDLVFYRDANAEVRNALNTGTARDAFAHLRAVGLSKGLRFAPEAASPDISEAAAKRLFFLKARNNLAIFARRRIDFSAGAACRLAVIMVMHDRFELTMLALSSLRGSFADDIQLILVDNGSNDATADIAQYVAGASILRFDRNIGYSRACNAALHQVTAELILFLNNDVELGPGAIQAAISRLDSDPGIGAVGGKIIRAHGRLQEAGCIIWRDGSTGGYLRDAAPLAPEANFVRDVDFCSGVFLLCRAAIVKNLGGFDTDFSPAYYEDADLCVRMAQAGYRIVYDPAIVIHHLEYGSGDAASAATQIRRGQQLFRRKHPVFLRTRPENSPGNLAAARSPQTVRKRVLFIEDTIPLRRLGSGYGRAIDIIHSIVAAGHAVSVFPTNSGIHRQLSMRIDLPEEVEILHDRELDQLAELLESRPGYYDLVWVSRTHNLARILPACRQAGLDPDTVPFVLDTEAVASVRQRARMVLNGHRSGDFDGMLRDELESASLCRHCIAVNTPEAALLRSAGLPNVSVLGTPRQADPTPESFDARSGLLFVAGIHHPDSPTLDALFWYLNAIFPALRRRMAAPPILNVAGHVAPGIDLSPFAGHPGIKLHGAAASLRPHYQRNRLFIAPTRFAAGAPYKLVEAAAFGLPIVATRLLADQLNWQDGAELLTAPVDDADRFAEQIARLYASPDLWSRLRENALTRIARDNNAEAFQGAVAKILHAAMTGVEEERRSQPPPTVARPGMRCR